MGNNISKADVSLLQKLASKYGFQLVSASEISPVMPEIKVSSESIIDKLVNSGSLKLEKVTGYRTLDKAGFESLRTFASANHLKINTKAVIIDLTPE
jgi:hypothetical protein